MEKHLFNVSLLKNIAKELLVTSQTVAVAESVTSGLLQFAFGSMENAQQFYNGGITAYNVAQKFKHLNVDPIYAINCNCVSQKTANEMALQVASLFNSGWGIGITGYATPVPESNNKVFAYFSISAANQIKASGKIESKKMQPPQPQITYVHTVMQELLKLLK